jgi:ribonuclease E
MKDALKNDRARIQVGRISSFGLMEMSRQRLRTGVLEASTRPCAHCDGTGLMRTAASAGLSALRMIEEEAARGRGSRIVLRAGREAAVYVLNKKRGEIAEVESRYGVEVEILIDESLEGARMSVESFGPPPAERPRFVATQEPEVDEEDLVDEEEDEEEEEGEGEAEAEEEEPRQSRREPRGERPDRPERSAAEGDDRGRKRRRRRGRRGGRRRPLEAGEEGYAEQERLAAEEAGEPSGESGPDSEPAPLAPALEDAPAEQDEKPKGRRRPRASSKDKPARVPVATPVAAEQPVAEAAAEPAAEEAPAKPKRGRRKAAAAEASAPEEALAVEAPAPEAPAAEAPALEAPAPKAANDEDTGAKKPRRSRAKAPPAAAESVAEADADAGEDGEDGPPRRGWWQRTFGA